MFAVLKREVKAYFYSPMAYVFIGMFICVSGIFFFLFNIIGGDANFLTILSVFTIIILFLIPVLTMRIMSEDRKNGTEVLLITSPTSIYEVVCGKFLAVLCVFGIMTAVSFIFPIILFVFGNPSFPPILGGYFGFILLGGACISIGVFISSLTENQIVAAILTLVSLLFVWVVDALASTIGGWIGKVMMWFSLLSRFEGFYMGILSLTSVVYYVSFIAVFLFLTVRVIEKRRWSQG